MATLGEELKAAREAKGYTLRQIAEKTRISHTFLKALEEDDYEVIPGDIFVTGFLRTYAKELGLDEKEMLAKYREIYPKPKEHLQPQETEPSQHQPRKPSLIKIRRGEKSAKKIPFYAIVAAGLALGALLTALSLILTPKEAKIPAPPPKPAPVAQPAPLKQATTAFKLATSFRHVTTVPSPQAKGPLTLKLTAKENSWYSYKTDKGQRTSAILQKGQTLSISAGEEILLDLGNAGGVQVEFGGKALNPFGPTGAPVKNILFTRDKPGVVLPPRSGQISNVMHGNDPEHMINR